MNISDVKSLTFWDEMGQVDFLQTINQENTAADLTKKVNNFFRLFLEEITQENHSSYIIRSSKGATDLTYLCYKYLPDENRTLKFVVKYIHPSQSANTRLCSAVVERLGLQSSKVYVVDPQYSGFSAKGKIMKLLSINSRYKKHDFAFMSAFSGANIGNLIENREFFRMDEHSIGRMLTLFGKVAVFDLMMGNDDRFYRPNTEFIDNPAAVDPFINSGNIMLELKATSENTRELSNVFCIDNTSSARLNALLNKKREVDFEEEKQLYLTSFFKAFSYFKDHNVEFASKIYEGILSEANSEANKENLSEEEKKHCFFNGPLMVKYLAEGVRAGYDQLKVQKSELPGFMQGCVATIAPSEQGNFFCKKILELANSCLQVLDQEESL